MPQVGSKLSLLMNNNGTEDTIYDDMIVAVLEDGITLADCWRDRK